MLSYPARLHRSNAVQTLTQPPHIAFEYPTTNYASEEDIRVVLLPASGAEFEVDLAPKGASGFPRALGINALVIPPGLAPGRYTLKARSRATGANDWSGWASLRFTVHEAGADLADLRIRNHQLETMIERGVNRTVTITDPDALPPAARALPNRKWFATAVYEGATPLLNEEDDYYRDPFNYYLAAVDALIEKDARFLTWHDVLDGKHGAAPLEVIVQFDIDGGPRSMQRLFQALAARAVPATIMTHRRGHYWYPYNMEEFGLDWLHQAEKAGWAIGYHNNALSYCVGDREGALYSSEVLRDAEERFSDDVTYLRQRFNLRTFTHHGGNVYNSRMTLPSKCGIICVDRGKSPELWRDIASSFSDGGFLSRPTTLRAKVAGLSSGLHLFRNHPLKYANFQSLMDAPPRSDAEAQAAGIAEASGLKAWRCKELEKEARWLRHRQATRSTVRLGHLRLDKPISSAFSPLSEVAERVDLLRASRSRTFERLYPWAEGDPRVFWWRMLEAWGPKRGEVLNVGALPAAEKRQTEMFLPSEVRTCDCDIDAAREPTYVLDITDAPEDMNGRFSTTLLFGLPYFSRPLAAVAACARLTEPGGRGLFGFAASTHPARGSIWHPRNRHLWRRDKEPLDNVGLRGNLWAFDDEGLADLFSSWATFRPEFMGHYWFVVAERDG